MLSRNGEDRNAEGMEGRDVRFLHARVYFVHGNHERFSGGAEETRQFFVEVSQAILAVYDQHQQRRVIKRHAGLAQYFLRDEGFVVRDDAAGIDNFQDATIPFGLAVNAVASNAGFVGNDGAARARQAVEERGLADVRPSDDHERWKFLIHSL